jgi:hypothetical protein
MVSATLLLLACIVTTLGMMWFALAKEPHWMQVRGNEPLTPPMKNTLRGLGATCIGTSFFVCMFADHPTMAVLVWIMLMPAGALLVAFALAWRAQWLAFAVTWLRSEARH